MERVAVIGLGSIATRHRKNLRQLFPSAKLYAMSASGRSPDETVSDADHLMDSIDALVKEHIQFAIVASPASFHAEHSIPLIKAGIPVLIEKPVVAKLAELKELQEVAGGYSTPIAVGYCLRYLSSAAEMKKYLKSELLGDIYHAHVEIGQYLPDWRPTKDYRETVSAKAALGGGVLLELSHEFDYTNWLLGDLTLQHALLRSTEELALEVEDSADVLLTTDQQVVVHMHLDFLQRSAYRQCRFVGSRGALEWDLIGNQIRHNSEGSIKTIYSEPAWDKNKMYMAMVQDFTSSLAGQPSSYISLDEAAKTVELIEKIKTRYPILEFPTPLED